MTNFYEILFDRYKDYIINNLQKYDLTVVKSNNNGTTKFPLISFEQRNMTDINLKTQSNVDKTQKFYFTLNIYAKNMIIGANQIASQVIINDICNNTYTFFEKLNMKLTESTPTPNLDTEILRHTIQYQCEIDNRGNIIRR